MASLNRVRVALSNFPGAPGVATFYLDAATTDVTPLKTFWTAIKDLFPNGMTATVPANGDQIDPATGTLTGAWTGTGGGTSVSLTSATNKFSGASGGLVRWNTGGVVAGRRVIARTYLVPLTYTAYENNGSLDPATITTIQNAANALITAWPAALNAWARPFPGKPAVGGKPAKPARSGNNFTITSASVPDLACVMRSRRI